MLRSIVLDSPHAAIGSRILTPIDTMPPGPPPNVNVFSDLGLFLRTSVRREFSSSLKQHISPIYHQHASQRARSHWLQLVRSFPTYFSHFNRLECEVLIFKWYFLEINRLTSLHHAKFRMCFFSFFSNLCTNAYFQHLEENPT